MRSLAPTLAVAGARSFDAHRFGGERSESEELQIAEQPGYVPTPEEEMLPAEYRPQMVFFRSSEPPGTIIVHTQERFLYIVQGDDRAIRYGVGVGRDGFQWQGLLKIIAQAGMAGLAPAAGDDRAPALSAALHGGRARAIRSARARSISATPSIASTAPTSRRRSATRSRRAASGWSIAT